MTGMEQRVQEARRSLGQDLLVLAHHYQRDEVVSQADHMGDSLELARRAAESEARRIVFCGVSFMAETAAVMARPGQQVFLPRRDAGCFLADQAEVGAVRRAWQALGQVMDVEREVLPVAYVNTSAVVKAFVGERGGWCCTSSSAERVLQAALAERPRVLLLPDQHLGRNVARRLGIPEEEIALWDPRYPPDDLQPFREARLILWRGACNVHVRFLPQDVERVCRQHPGAQVIVHPECRPEVAALADEVGSTSLIVRRIREAPPGSAWAIGTEQRLVARLARDHPDREVFSLVDPPPVCATMSLTRLDDLARILSRLSEGAAVEPVVVPEEVARPAREPVRRMLQLVG